ncbi:MAG: hypothetical protein JKX91_15695 [Rhizobiaceae bacterium]|nr:hypothetical protein [Rhizobiaceae bacterium]
MLLASSAGAVSVTSFSGDAFGDTSDVVGSGDDGSTTSLTGVVSSVSLSGLLQIGVAGEFMFKFENTFLGGNLALGASVSEVPTDQIEGFTLTWLNSAFGVLDLVNGLPAPDPGELGIVTSFGSVVYLLATWDNVTGGVGPTLTFNLSQAVTTDIPSSVPLPPSLVLFGSGLLGLGFLSVRRRRKATSV